MAPLGVSFSLLIEDQGLLEVDLSAMVNPFDSNQFVLCPWAMSFFKSCALPFSLLLQKFLIQVLLMHSLENFEHYFANMRNEYNCVVV